ncbi:MAG: anthranilate synthase component I family protein [Bacteroidales bacterium]|nr:anthranilate synthase component I family protein [Candidatus Liminaster caballi]
MKLTYKTACKTILGDLITPVSAYLRVRDAYPQSVLMECADYHGGENAKSFIGLHPIASVSVSHGVCTICHADGSVLTSDVEMTDGSQSLSDSINDFLGRYDISGDNSENCGLFGYTTFNTVRYTENISVKDERQDENDAPDMQYILFKDVIVFDHYRNEITIIELLEDGEPDDLDQLERDLMSRPYQNYDFRPVGDYWSTLTDDEHRANIRKGIQHCKRGDVFQIVLSRRFKQRYEGDDFKLYRALRSINPSPYLFYFDFGGFRIFGSSPETHCRIQRKEQGIEGTTDQNSKSAKEHSHVTFRAYIDPIAGTTKRTGNAEQDRKNAIYLKNDPKENAEHVMLVDLARNDLSRNCHGVKVDFYKDMQFYSHVIHLVSRVSGELNADADPIKSFLDTFPAGTLSGAPKVRAMQLISEYEPHNRGAYGGCIGFIGFDKSLNQAITIRTFVSRNSELWFQAGGGIVAKSDVEYELQEVNNKLGALRKAIEKAKEL